MSLSSQRPDLVLFGMISRHPGRNRGGVSMSSMRLANALAEQGVLVDFIVGHSGYTPEWAVSFSPNVRFVVLRRLSRLAITVSLIRYIVRRRPRVLLAMDQRASLLAARVTRLPLMKLRLWISPRNNYNLQMQGWPEYKRLRRTRELQRVHRASEGVIAISHGLAADYMRATKVESDKVHIVYNPVVTTELYELAKKPTKLPWKDKAPIIISVGRLTIEKDHQSLLYAFAELRKIKSVRLLIIGEGPCRQELEKKARHLRLEKDVAFLGWVDNPYAYMARAQVFAHSPQWEAFGNVLAEALALGLPVVATDCPGAPREILGNGRYGELVPVGDMQALVQALGSLLKKPPISTYQRAGAERFEAAEIAKQYVSLLRL